MLYSEMNYSLDEENKLCKTFLIKNKDSFFSFRLYKVTKTIKNVFGGFFIFYHFNCFSFCHYLKKNEHQIIVLFCAFSLFVSNFTNLDLAICVC